MKSLVQTQQREHAGALFFAGVGGSANTQEPYPGPSSAHGHLEMWQQPSLLLWPGALCILPYLEVNAPDGGPSACRVDCPLCRTTQSWPLTLPDPRSVDRALGNAGHDARGVDESQRWASLC